MKEELRKEVGLEQEKNFGLLKLIEQLKGR